MPNLNHLKYFVDAVECGSISGAADKNLVTHPAISRAIKALEDQLEVKLLAHKKKSFEVTSEGLAVAEKARELLGAVKSFNKDHLYTSVEPTGTVSLGISRTIGQTLLPVLLEKIEISFPKIKINVQFGTTGEIVEKVANGSVDLGITIGHQKFATLKQSILRRGHFVLVAGKSWKRIANNDLSKATFILTEPRFETELLKKEFYRKYKTPLLVKHEIGSWDMITYLTAKSHSIGLVPDICLINETKSELYKVKSDWFECSYEIYLHQAKAAQTCLSSQALVKIIENNLWMKK